MREICNRKPAMQVPTHSGFAVGRLEEKKKKARRRAPSLQKNVPGSDLLSHPVTRAVPSALEDLTSVFGMGTGVAPPLKPPGNNKP